ncbi:hypothetical protein [Nitriliruptor alkaliphilus]|uniref:hypothetical protein n=1 Tax=Nitriliruptor alkaliphilus TaxID=427918 RepID=UPI0012EEDD14|nr:hypothetical protein [Nitriliruptor alkaliphilus]
MVVSLLVLAPTAAFAAPASPATARGPGKVTAVDRDRSHPDADKAARKDARDDAKAARKAAHDTDKAARKAAHDTDKAAREAARQGATPADRDVPTPPPASQPSPSPEPEPATGAPAPPPPSARQPSPAPPAPPPPERAEGPVLARPVGDTSSPTRTERAAAPPRSTTGVVRGAIEVATGTTGDVGGEIAASLGAAASTAGERLASGLTAAARTAPEMPVPARDLGVPIGVLALVGAYLAASRWLDRGGLPMTVTEGREDDVQLVL